MSSMKAPVILAALACAASWLIALAAMPSAPAQMPIHWSLEGEPDGYTSGKAALLLIPALQIQVALIMLAIAGVAKPGVRRPAAWVAYAMTVSFTWVELTFALRAWGHDLPLNLDAAVALAIPWLACGYLLPRVPPNLLFGIRIARTLNNERVWYATHRAARWWILAGGVGLIASVFVPVPFWVSLAVFVGGPVVASIVVAYTAQPSD